MDLWKEMLLPLTSIRMPASGDVTMNYSPWTNWGWSDYEAGDPETENEIFANVALPGKQLGKLTDAVMALIELAEKKDPRLAKGKSERAVAIWNSGSWPTRLRPRKKNLWGLRNVMPRSRFTV